MSRRRLGLASAALLVACAAPAPEAPPPEPAPVSPERQRFERWKQTEAPADPRADFARDAAAEAERRRSEALARGTAPGTAAVEAEMRSEQLEELSTWSGGCFAEEPDLAHQDDWILHRKLSREDFLAPEKSDEVEPVVWIPFSEIGAYVMVRIACVARTRVHESEPGRYTAELEEIRFFSMLSRDGSWWNPDARGNAEWIRRHEQLHFDVAELFAEEQNANVGRVREETRRDGPDPETATRAFRIRLTEFLAAQQRRFEEVEHQYDRETKHGNDLAAQTEWFARVKRGLAALPTPAS